jgi:hypothetical protein
MNIIPFQLELRPEYPEFPNVYGTLDYREFRETLVKIDEILIKSGLEQELVTEAVSQYVADNHIDSLKFYNSKQSTFHYRKFRHALRCNIARHLTGESYRLFSIRLADSGLFKWFTNISVFGCCKAISKSSLERYEKSFPEELIARKIREWLAGLSDADKAVASGLYQPIDCKKTFMDSTCIKANIHFPVDWVLLRDAVRSLLLAIKNIRKRGLKHRMIEPSLFLKQMNKFCIAMAHTRRKANSKKQRKIVLREMKKLSRCVAKHGKRYRQLLGKEWEKTDWTEVQALQVIHRLDAILEQLPTAIKQAHERIIGERLVATKDKILSLYDKDAHVIVRGKTESEVEFGQGLLLTEQIDGLIIDWELFKDQPPADSKLLEPTIKRIEKYYEAIESICTDRAFGSKDNDAFLQTNHIYNAVCPKSPKQLQEKLSDPIFLLLQTRRSQTEARIGIFKNVFLGKPLRSRITAYKRLAVDWCVLTHNLWVLSRKAIAYERSLREKQRFKKAA